ncbi:MAG: ATP-grasp domain-containing protein [Candidatus Heimdallarchaeota archaeon]
MTKDRIFILEFVTGGGFNQVEIPDSLFAEGYGMLRSVIEDFKDLDFEIETIIDFRLTLLSKYLKADFINVIQKSDNFFKKFKDCVKKNKFCFIIAPEFSNILYKLTKIAFDNNKTVLSVNLSGIKLGSSKLKTYYFFQENKINTPTTFLIPYKQDNFDINFIIKKFRQFNTPIIIKPEDGVGAEDIYYFNAEKKILELFSKKSHLIDQSRTYILQKYVQGKDLSVSLIGHKNPPMIISINTQDVDIKNLGKESHYFGGYTPVENWVDLKINLEKYIEKFKQFDGYFGLDFIQQENGRLNFIEINPRLTTSYIGIRNIIKENLMSVLLNIRENKFDLDEIPLQYFSKFGHLTLKYKGKVPYEEINKKIIPQILKDVPEIVTPPIKLKIIQQDCYSCFIATKTKDPLASNIRIKRILQILKEKDFIVKSSKLI